VSGDVCFVLEDLSASGCAPLDGARDAGAAVAALGALHATFAGAFEGPDPPPRGPLPVAPVDLDLAPQIAAYFRGCWAVVRARPEYALPAAAQSLLDEVAAAGAYEALTARLNAPPRSLVHGDFRPENLAVAPDGAVVAYDWQFCCVGNGAYDLAYFLGLALEPDERRARDAALRAAYAAAAGVGDAALARDLADAARLALASFVIGAATAGDAPESVATHRRGLARLAAAALDWTPPPV
jgi:aminoglycoside phosphotransferase (APT) family kinase protein